MKRKGLKIVLTNLIVLSGLFLFAQTPQSTSLEVLLENSKDEDFKRQERVDAYSKANNLTKQFRDSNGNLVLLWDVSPTGVPLYKSSHNSGAAQTTGVTALRQGGGLGLNLQGEGMVVGVWDEGLVNHTEFSDRLLSQQGTDAVHANHVTGTIIASGINDLAKGMAPMAKAYTFDFSNDETEMLTLTKPDQSSLLLSNHSYGLVSGWHVVNNNWQWFGDTSISGVEDYKFGYYSSNAAFWDQIALGAPYYTIVKSAGNDRNNTGNGSRPPDCNGGDGYDCISDVSASKNIITVGAVNKVSDYTGPASVQMSSFSSWGPTDDGRIKPDFVAAGVNLFSTITNNNYGSLSGTSMASPNATGSLLLLQELYRNLYAGDFMKAATLKALAIHTIKEAGTDPGPDYKFGWGLLDVKAAANVLLTTDNANTFVLENTLQQGQVYELQLTPKANEKITATLVWTDPAGIPVPVSLDPTNIMLVNDLDIRLVDDAGSTQSPWILDPQNPGNPATQGNNIRDNVEKVEFNNPEPRTYSLRVSHKGNLQGGKQDFSLIVTYTSVNEPLISYYWIGGSGSWEDVSHWSLTSGGTPVGSLPDSDNRVIFDENSFSETGSVEINSNVEVGGFTWLSKVNSEINLNSNNLNVLGNFICASAGLRFNDSGTLSFKGAISDETTLSFNETSLNETSIEIDGESSFGLSGTMQAGSINIKKGKLRMENTDLQVRNLITSGTDAKEIEFAAIKISDLKKLDLSDPELTLSLSDVVFESADIAEYNFGSKSIHATIVVPEESELEIEGSNTLDSVAVEGTLVLLGNNIFEAILLNGGSELKLEQSTTQTMPQQTEIVSLNSDRVSISSLSGVAGLLFEGRYKLCFDFLDITNVSILGQGIINAGESSILANADNWAKDKCEDILFPDFDIKYNCQLALLELIDKSGGAIDSWLWSTTTEGGTILKEDSQKARAIFQQLGTAEVTLTIANDNDERSYTKDIEVLVNELAPNQIVLNGLNLFSVQVADGYEWYDDYTLIEGASSRNFVYNGAPGSYFVLTKDASCNRISNTILITSVGEESNLEIFPNPANGSINIKGLPVNSLSEIKLINSLGVVTTEVWASHETLISTHNLPSGIYFVKIISDGKSKVTKIIIE